MEWVLGIDTSNYTTSLCALAMSDNLYVEARKLLPVTYGERGLRQSDALFFHVQRLSSVMDDLVGALHRQYDPHPQWTMVGVSVHPRPLSSSYMPVFQAGRGFGETFARALGIPLLPVSHQEGHLGAAEFFLDLPQDEPFLAVHLSGGTSDVLYAQRTRFGYVIETVGEGADLHAGQFVDRVGVALGLPFPAGPSLEALAGEQGRGLQSRVDDSAEVEPQKQGLPGRPPAKTPFRLHSRVKGAQMSFSGPCSAALRAVEAGVKPQEIAWAVQVAIANSLVKAIQYAFQGFPHVRHCVIAGGVASNAAIRQRVLHRLKILHPELKIHFPPSHFASDNALGVANLAKLFTVHVD